MKKKNSGTFSRWPQRRSGLVVLVGLFATEVGGCMRPNKTAVEEVGRRLDGVGAHIDDYGIVACSVPVLAAAESVTHNGAFDFGVKDGPDEYLHAARTEVQGALGVSSQRARSNRVGIQGRLDLQDLKVNRLMDAAYADDLLRYQRRTAMQDSGALLGMLLPILNPTLAVATPQNVAALLSSGMPSTPATGAVSGSNATATGTTETTEGDMPATADSPSVPSQLLNPNDPTELTPEAERYVRAREMLSAFERTSTAMSGSSSRPEVPSYEHSPPEIGNDVLLSPGRLNSASAGRVKTGHC